MTSSKLIRMADSGMNCFYDTEGSIMPMSGDLSPDNPLGGLMPRDSIASGLKTLAERESAITMQMAMKEEHYTEVKQFRIFIGTWNVNGQSAYSADEGLGPWLACDPTPPDIYAIGFQELDLSKEAFLFNDSPREEEWFNAVQLGLHQGAKYTKVKLVRLIGMMLVVFVKTNLIEYIDNVAAEVVGTGVLGRMGNKGGVAVRFDFHNTSICLVNCHLAAHVEEYERRNEDYNNINSRLVFTAFKPPKHIKDHDHIYWFGDLNYRIMDLNADQVKALLNEKEIDVVLEHDQLKRQHALKKVFVGYQEGPIRHQPTYKYDPGTDEWDTSEKNRPPAWCDRVLWRGGPTQLLQYRSHPRLKLSDHKPVSALFSASIKVINQEKYKKTYEDVMKKLDQLENEFLPQVAVDKLEVIFPSVKFRESHHSSLIVANTGQVPVKFVFIPKLNQVSYCKSWLQINPYTAMIKPGESCDIELLLCVGTEDASKLNAGKEKLEDILVLHLEGGKDIFITISGSYIPSSFGSSIETLIRLQDPIRTVPLDRLQKLERGEYDPNTDKPCWNIPKELWLLMDHLFKYALQQEDLFQTSGLFSEFKDIRDMMDEVWPDTGLHCSVHSAAESLLVFLEALREPLIPYSLYYQALEYTSNFSLCKKLIEELPQSHQSVFYYIISFLRELLRHSNLNKLDPKLLATIFGGIILKAPPDDPIVSSRAQANSSSSMPAQTVRMRHNLQSVRTPNNFPAAGAMSGNAERQAAERQKAAFVYHFLMNEY